MLLAFGALETIFEGLLVRVPTMIRVEMNITEGLAAALDALVDASDEAERTPTDRQAARRAIEQAKLVASLARREGFGGAKQR